MEINKKIIGYNLTNNPNKNLREIKYITIHNTGNYSPTASASNHADYLYNNSYNDGISWHYTVDKKEIWQSFLDTRACWHAGDGNGDGNMASIGIEICVNDKNGFPQACDNAAFLVAKLLKTYNLDISRVVQHNKWSGKNCPSELRSGAWGVTWNQFIDKIKVLLDDKKETLEINKIQIMVDDKPYQVESVQHTFSDGLVTNYIKMRDLELFLPIKVGFSNENVPTITSRS